MPNNLEKHMKIILKSPFWLRVASMLLIVSSPGAQAAPGASKAPVDAACASVVSSAQMASDRADWVIEADIRGVVHMIKDPSGNELIIENTKIVRERGHRHLGKTTTVMVDRCFPSAANIFRG